MALRPGASSSEARVVPHGISRDSGAHHSGKSGQKCDTERCEVHLRCQGLEYSGLLMPTAKGEGQDASTTPRLKADSEGCVQETEEQSLTRTGLSPEISLLPW